VKAVNEAARKEIRAERPDGCVSAGTRGAGKDVMTRRFGGWRVSGCGRGLRVCAGAAGCGNHRALVKDLQCPVNILVGPGSPAVPELEKIGVARVSVVRGDAGHAGAGARGGGRIEGFGTYATLRERFSYADVNRMMNGEGTTERLSSLSLVFGSLTPGRAPLDRAVGHLP